MKKVLITVASVLLGVAILAYGAMHFGMMQVSTHAALPTSVTDTGPVQMFVIEGKLTSSVFLGDPALATSTSVPDLVHPGKTVDITVFTTTGGFTAYRKLNNGIVIATGQNLKDVQHVFSVGDWSVIDNHN